MGFTHPVHVRYLEVDAQGVVFNMWYLAYLDDALAAFVEAGGLPYPEMMADGYDVQLVHTELDWHGPLRYGEPAAVDVAVDRVGRTSFTLRFAVRSGDRPVATASTVYVVIALDGSGTRDIPPRLLAALGA